MNLPQFAKPTLVSLKVNDDVQNFKPCTCTYFAVTEFLEIANSVLKVRIAQTYFPHLQHCRAYSFSQLFVCNNNKKVHILKYFVFDIRSRSLS